MMMYVCTWFLTWTLFLQNMVCESDVTNFFESIVRNEFLRINDVRSGIVRCK